MRGDATREKIKKTAEALFADRGFNAVSVRDIVEAAGQKNTGSLHYYFRTKEALALELVQDGARRVDEDRNRQLDLIEAEGGPRSLREAIRLLAFPFVVDDVFMRFISRLMQENYNLLLEGVEQEDSGYRRVIAHVRRLLPEISRPILSQRFRLMIMYVVSTLALQGGSRRGREVWSRFWDTPGAEEIFLDTVEGMLSQPVSAEAAAAHAAGPVPARATG